ncbi:D13 protein [Plasmodium gonderi]|uniref:D13 protein n=1 Tax=Plasmodium gonderi TaxID=77519 RepID=A0A1Y1JIP6_PLAGO|nr:D13 protein [Plasmodium gonderi]GAW82401.1 D13 protein [Plasmodium gonderi]
MVYATLLSEEDLSRFRTKQCKRLLNGGCNFGIDRCQYSHNEFWNRRCPFYLSDSSFIRYITVMCPDVETKSDGSINSLCQRGGECPFAHSSEEILYHPLYYKTKRCEDYKKGSCNTYYCPFIHGLAETRNPGTYKLPFTNGINIPNIPNVIIVDKIDITSKGNSNISCNDKYVKNMISVKRRNELKPADSVTDNDMKYEKFSNYMASTAYSSIDSIRNSTTNACKMNTGKGSLPFNDNLMHYSEEDLKKSMNMFNHENSFDNFETYAKDGMRNSINSFTNFDHQTLLPTYTHGTKTEITRSSHNMVPCTHYNELFTDNINGVKMQKGHNHLCINSKVSTEPTENMNTNKNWNSYYNMLKLKQNYSSCSTAAHELNFTEHDVTSDDLIDDEEEELDNYPMNTLLHNTNDNPGRVQNGSGSECQYVHQNEDGNTNFNFHCMGGNTNYGQKEQNEQSCKRGSAQYKPCCSVKDTDEERNNSEINLLEIIKCLKNLYERIMKGNLVFSPEQWDNIAQITYEIVGVVEFNRVLKLKRNTDKLKYDVTNANRKQYSFDVPKREEEINSDRNKSSDMFDKNLMMMRHINTLGDVHVKDQNDKSQRGELNVENSTKMKKEEIVDLCDINELENLGLNRMKIYLENKKKDILDINSMVMDINEESHILNLYNETRKESYLSGKSNFDLFNLKTKTFSPPLSTISEMVISNREEEEETNMNVEEEKTNMNVEEEKTNMNVEEEKTNMNAQEEGNNMNGDEENSKDLHFLDYYNLNNDNLNFTETKDNTDKILTQQPFVSFFSFLSE